VRFPKRLTSKPTRKLLPTELDLQVLLKHHAKLPHAGQDKQSNAGQTKFPVKQKEQQEPRI